MANPNPTPPPAGSRFTTENAAEMGRRGAAERERRALEGLQRIPWTDSREDDRARGRETRALCRHIRTEVERLTAIFNARVLEMQQAERRGDYAEAARLRAAFFGNDG